MLSLPDAPSGLATRTARDVPFNEIKSLRVKISDLKKIQRLKQHTSAAHRREAVREIIDGCTDDDFDLQLKEAVKDLYLETETSNDKWNTQVQSVYKKLEDIVSNTVSKWRKLTRKRSVGGRAYNPQKSFWSIAYLEEVRRLLKSWSFRAREARQVNRANRQSQGVFASRLLDHINNLKRDRVKTGADLVIQAARGYVPSESEGWEEKHRPCHVLLFEDLLRYRFAQDRSKKENNRLMKWCHREIRHETEMQAEIYDIRVSDIEAGFSSQYHGASGAVGCRTIVLTDDLIDRQKSTIEKMGKELSLKVLKNGVRIPWYGGPDFTTLNAAGNAISTHADINAAQMLQRRFWHLSGEAYRIRVVEVEVDGQKYLYPSSKGKRVLGALKAITKTENGYSRFHKADGDFYQIESIKKTQWEHDIKGQENKAEASEDDDLAVVEFLAKNEAVLFRDPSGHIHPKNEWYKQKDFWRETRAKIGRALQPPS